MKRVVSSISELARANELTWGSKDMLFFYYYALINYMLYPFQARSRRTFALIRALFVFVFLHYFLIVYLKLHHGLLHCALLNLHGSGMMHHRLHTSTLQTLFIAASIPALVVAPFLTARSIRSGSSCSIAWVYSCVAMSSNWSAIFFNMLSRYICTWGSAIQILLSPKR